MTKQQILEKAIQRAIDGGWKDELGLADKWRDSWYENQNVLIFNHDFAKSLWGERELIVHPFTFGKLTRVYRGIPVLNPKPLGLEALLIPAYKFHLLRMVMSDDPIKYLGENL